MKIKKQKEFLMLIGNAVVCNRYVHIEQIKYIRRLLWWNADKLQIIKNIILEKTEEKNNFEVNKLTVSNLSKNERKYLKKIILKIMCFDGEFDADEQKFFNEVFGINKEWTEKYSRKYLKKFKKRIFGGVLINTIRIFQKYGNILMKSKKINAICKSIADSVSGEFYNNSILKKIFHDACDMYIDDYFETKIRWKLDDFNNLTNRLSMKEPTIALVGRTMTGKSSFFSLLCHDFEEFIGSGGQRTTRFVMAAHIHGIRIIDTPGLNAFAKKGRDDDRNTMKAIQESDIIYFFVTNDTVAEETEEHIKKIVDLNRPVRIIVNYKNGDNFRYKSAMQEFLANPRAWYESENEERLSGIIDNMMRYAQKSGYADMLVFHRIYIYAAMQARYRRKQGKNSLKIPLYMKRKIYLDSEYPVIKKAMFDDICRDFCSYRTGIYYQYTKKLIENLLELNGLFDKKLAEKIVQVNEKEKRTLKRINEININVHEKQRELYTNQFNLNRIEIEVGNLKYKEWKTYCEKIMEDICAETQCIYKEYCADLDKVCYAIDCPDQSFLFSMDIEIPKERKILPLNGMANLAVRIAASPVGFKGLENIFLDLIKKIETVESKKEKRTQERRNVIENLFEEIKKQFENEIHEIDENYKVGLRNQSQSMIDKISDCHENVKMTGENLRLMEHKMLQEYARCILKIIFPKGQFNHAQVEKNNSHEILIYGNNVSPKTICKTKIKIEIQPMQQGEYRC